MPIVQAHMSLGELGQDASALDLSGYSDESTLTGLPVYAEFGLGILAVIALSYAWGGAKKVLKGISSRRKKSQRNPGSVVVADFNRDGKMDIAVASFGGGGVGNSPEVQVFLGNGDGWGIPAKMGRPPVPLCC